MAGPDTAALREMATHRGLKLRSSRRRKPGGDFGRFGLADAAGRPVFGIEGDVLTASAEDVEGYLRSATRSDWSGSTKGLKRKTAPRPAPEKKAKPPPRFRPEVASMFAKLPAARRAEAVTALVDAKGVRVERIVSAGQATPTDAPMVQDRDEWVIVLAGEARLRIRDSAEVTLKPGDHVTIAAGERHWVTFTSADPPTVWLAVHFAG